MSLRHDIHDAFDEIAPSPIVVTDRVVMAVVQARPAARTLWSLRVRAPMSLIAVLLAIALVVIALVGGRVVSDWHAFNTPHQVTPMTPLQKLEARPFRLRAVRSNADCPDGPYDKNGDAGVGPMHSSGSSVEMTTPWGSYFHDELWADGPVTGPILVRGEDLLTSKPIIFVGEYAAGRAIGTDVLGGVTVDQRPELVVETPAAPWAWQFIAGMVRSTDCEAWQIDGPGFSETFSFHSS